MRRAKIVGTLGPSSNTVKQIEDLIRAGLNVARINMSHGTHDGHREVIKNVRIASKNLDQEVAILLDLQGPKIRVDKLPTPLMLENGQEWVIGTTAKEGDYPQYKGRFIPTIYEKLVDDCHDGARILFDDGKMQARALKRDGDVYVIEVTVGGELKSNKGINLPDCIVSAPAFTEKDEKDLMFGLGQGIDYIALSFVRRAEDVLQVKEILHKLKMQIPIVSKIEKPQAIENLDEILKVTDVIMVARGDMGVEVGNHLVPSLQKLIITKCNQALKPVITATQMLESMTESPTPTRAEASDVANAIWDGTDAVMLSGETASGKFPVLTVETMSAIVFEAEKTPKERPLLRNMDLSNVNASVMVAASMIAEKIDAKRILSMTESGHSALKVSMFRPKTPVLAVTNTVETARRICLYWGVYPYLISEFDQDQFNFQEQVINRIKREKFLSAGDKLVITRGDGKFFQKGSSNSVKVEILHDMPDVTANGSDVDEYEDAKKKILLDTNVCASCQNCVAVCPFDIWTVSNTTARQTMINKETASKCTLDMQCVERCPTGAIEIMPKGEWA